MSLIFKENDYRIELRSVRTTEGKVKRDGKKFCFVGKIHYRNCIYVILELILKVKKY